MKSRRRFRHASSFELGKEVRIVTSASIEVDNVEARAVSLTGTRAIGVYNGRSQVEATVSRSVFKVCGW